MFYKKSFTLIEVLISIVLFSLIMIFLYQTLNLTQQSNTFFDKKVQKRVLKQKLKQLLFLDISLSTDIKIEVDKNKNTILHLITSNTYHNSFFTNITYLVTKENNLVRIENKTKFNKTKINYDYLNQSYIDIIYKDITKFKITQKDKTQNIIYIKFKDEKDMIFNYKSMR